MAISGAAASSNMGSNSIKALTPTLALLNVRLGYWLKNPRSTSMAHVSGRNAAPRRLFLWSEISGRLYENSDSVYLTDGGHIENLGVYELLRRRCKVIIAVDAEADAPMNFGPPDDVPTLRPHRSRRPHRSAMDADPRAHACADGAKCRQGGRPGRADEPDDMPRPRPRGNRHHRLRRRRTGLSRLRQIFADGDENDYIRDYARRNDRSPHETTGDQFFWEEQFEVYRALGFHMTHGLLCRGQSGRGRGRRRSAYGPIH